MSKKAKHNPERRAWKGKSYKKGRERISALRLRDFVEDVRRTMADCEAMGSSEYMLEGIEEAFKKHGIPQLVVKEEHPGEDAVGFTYKGPKIVATIETFAGEFEDIDE